MTAHYHDIVEQAKRDEVISGIHTSGIHATPAPLKRIYRHSMKRFLDIFLVILGLPVVLPVILVLACIVALDGGSPFYTQERVGRNGRIYRIWKLRSMVHLAEVALERHLAANPAARSEWNLTQKLKRDPRVTRIGRFLRAYSLDELPQLWNVLKGDMSLVGPRPMMPNQRILYPGSAYYALRPGITGYWQVMQRNRSSFADRAWYDTQYYRDLSLRTDLSLLVATVRVVLRATGHCRHRTGPLATGPCAGVPLRCRHPSAMNPYPLCVICSTAPGKRCSTVVSMACSVFVSAPSPSVRVVVTGSESGSVS